MSLFLSEQCKTGKFGKVGLSFGELDVIEFKPESVSSLGIFRGGGVPGRSSASAGRLFHFPKF